MKYPKPLVKDMYVYLLTVENGYPDEALLAAIELECAIYEAETGANMEIGFQSNWEEDLMGQVKDSYNYKKQ